MVSVLVAPLLLAGGAAADPLGVAVRLVMQVEGGGGGGATPTASLFGEVTGPAEPAALPDLLERAVRSAPTLAKAKVDRAIAEATIAQAQAWGEWTIDANAAGSIRQSLASDVRTVSLDGTIARRIFTGGTVGVRAASDWGRTVRTGEIMGTPFEETQAGYTETITATFSQPLLRGRGDLLVRSSIRVAEIQRDAAALGEDVAVIAVVRDLVLAYFDLAQRERELAIRRASLDLTRERLRVTQAGIAAGGTARAESIAVEQAIATGEEEILAAELAIVEQSLTLRRLAGLAIAPGQMLLSSSVELAIPGRTWDAAALLEATLAHSPEMAQLRALEASATIEVEVNEHGVLPSLDLALSFGPSGSDDDPASATVNMATFDDFTAAARLTYRTSIGQGAAKAIARKSRASRERVRVDAEDVKAVLALAITRATTQVLAAERRNALATRAISLAEQNLVAEQARMTSGKSRNVDVLERQDELRAAQLRAARAILDWHRAATLIDALTGQLLPKYGVAVR